LTGPRRVTTVLQSQAGRRNGGFACQGLIRRRHRTPELNAAERPWAYLRQRYLSNRAYHDYDLESPGVLQAVGDQVVLTIAIVARRLLEHILALIYGLRKPSFFKIVW